MMSKEGKVWGLGVGERGGGGVTRGEMGPLKGTVRIPGPGRGHNLSKLGYTIAQNGLGPIGVQRESYIF